MNQQQMRFVLLSIMVALAYALAGRLSLLLAIPPPGFAAPIWPAAGIALAAIILGGNRYLPSILVGSFAANLIVSLNAGGGIANVPAMLPALLIACGTTLQAFVGGYLVRRSIELPTALRHYHDIFVVIIQGGLVGCLVNAIIGPLVLYFSGILPAAAFLSNMMTWWAGDAIGVALFAPMLLLLVHRGVSAIRKLIVTLPILVFAAIAVFVFLSQKENKTEQKQYNFDSAMQNIAADFEKDVQVYLNILTANERFINASNYVSHEEFATFTGGFLKKYPSIQSLSWNRKVTHEERADFEKEIRTQGFPDFVIKSRFGVGAIEPSVKQAVYYPVTYINPHKANEAAHGFDTYGLDNVTGNLRQKVLNQARDEGRAIVTGRLSVVQAEGQYGLIIYNPVYSNDLKDDSVASRQKHLIGYTAGVFVMPTMMQDVATKAEELGADVVLRDLSTPQDKQLLYDSRTPDYKAAAQPIEKPAGALSASAVFDLAGHQWELQFIEKADAASGGDDWSLWYLLIGGLFCSAVFGVFLIVVSSNIEAIQNEVKQQEFSYALWLAGAATLLSILFAVLVAQIFVRQEEGLIKENIRKEIMLFKEIISHSVHTQMQALERIADRWSAQGKTSKEAWQRDVRNYITAHPGIRTVKWVDSSLHVRWVEPLQGNEAALNLDLSVEEKRKAVLEKARDKRKITITEPVDLAQGGKGFFTYFPIYIGDRFDGFILTVFDTDRLFNHIMPEAIVGDFGIQSVVDGEVVYSFGAPVSASYKDKWQDKDVIEVYDTEWDVTVWPTQEFLKQQQSSLPSITLLGGVLFSLLLGFALYTALISNHRSKLLRKQREVLLKNEEARVTAVLKLRESEAFLQLMMDNNPDFIFVKDSEFRIVQANNAFLNVYPEEMRDKVIGYTTLEGYNQAEADEFLVMDRKAFSEGYSETIEKIHFPDGNQRTLFTQKIRFENIQKEQFILGIGRDVTDREKLLEELIESNQELERFAYVCSHDLQEPLRMIRSFSTKLRFHIADKIEGDEKGQRYFKFAIDGAERAQELISDILAYSSLERDTQKPEKVSAAGLIDVVRQNLSAALEECDGSITAEDALPEIIGNKAQLYQLFQNLINNGIKYKREEVTPKVHVGVQDLGELWQFYVQDNGIGIEERHMNKIFEVFQRLHKKHEYSGTGIGLATAKKIVDRHGGTIWLDSEVGKGSIFYFTIRKTAS